MTNDESHVDSETIAEGVAGGLKKATIKLTDNRVLLIFLFVVIIGTYFFYRSDQNTKANSHQTTIIQQQADKIQQQADKLEQQQRAAQVVCQQQNKSAVNFNTLIDQLDKNINNSITLTVDQKNAALAQYELARPAIVDCSALASGK